LVPPSSIGPEKAETTPADREIGADQFAVQLGRKAREVLGPEAAIDIVAIRPEILRIARAQESPESGAENAPLVHNHPSGVTPNPVLRRTERRVPSGEALSDAA